MKFNKSKAVFLLGGHDLEMITIREILEENGIKYFDESPKWGAKLSDYTKQIEENKEKEIYAVELIVDDKSILETYTIEIIDHHNEHVHKDASILQVLALLEIKPSRDQKLIAANDFNHIEGMKCLGASSKEIEDIRKRDRQRQGVTEEQEEVAKNEIETIVEKNSLYILKTSLNTFTPVVDFYNKRPLIVYNDETLMFYGDISKLKDKYKEHIHNKDVFHGLSYLGFDKEYLKSENIESYVDEIIQSVDVMSYHSFMFSFSFDKNNKDIDCNLRDNIEINEDFAKQLKDAEWQYAKFDLTMSKNDVRIYNEYSYYTEPVRDMLYNTQEKFRPEETSYYFTKEVKDGEYNITLLSGEKYELKLTDVYLRLFETGIGVLVFETENHTYSDFEDILNINEYGRRVYPQYLDNSCKNYASKTKESFLADMIEVKLNPKAKLITEDFREEYEEKIPDKIIISKHIVEVLGESVFSQTKSEAFCKIKPILDDRMFIVSYAENKDLMLCLQRDDENYKKNDDWYRYLFVDGKDKTVQYAPMQAKLAENSTYPRWLGWGTLWGVTRYSFVALTTAGGRGLILPHTQYHYHQMAIIILAIQASLARFRDEVSTLSNLKDDNSLEDKVQVMYEYYIKFINKLHFRELTSQDQGIELYGIAKKVMNFDQEIKDLDNEIAELHTYVQMKAEKKRNERLESISKLGAVFLPPSLLTGIYGGNVTNFVKDDATSMYIAAASITLSAFLGWVIVKFKDEDIKFLASTGMVLLLAGSLLLFPTQPIDHNDDNTTKKEQHVRK